MPSGMKVPPVFIIIIISAPNNKIERTQESYRGARMEINLFSDMYL